MLTFAERVICWATEMFGPIAIDPRERGLRFLEEALEVAQAVGVDRPTAEKLLDRAYTRPVGDAGPELGQAQLTLSTLALVCGVDAQAAAEREFDRVLAIPKEEWTKRHQAKIDKGIAT